MPLVRKPAATAPVAPQDAAAIAADLMTGSEDARWNAARVAAEAPGGLALLREALSREGQPRVREAIFTALARMHTPESAAVVLDYLRSDDSSLRTGALDALRTMPDVVAALIPALLSDGDADVRLLACELVRSQPAGKVGAMLGPVLATERQPNVCAAAVEVVAEGGGPELLPLLVQCAARFPDDPFLAFAIKAARERIGSQAK
jgi:HEAT repeat protein